MMTLGGFLEYVKENFNDTDDQMFVINKQDNNITLYFRVGYLEFRNNLNDCEKHFRLDETYVTPADFNKPHMGFIEIINDINNQIRLNKINKLNGLSRSKI